MNCPKCSKKTRVADSRPWNKGANIRRYRKCKCGHRFVTMEILVEQPGITKDELEKKMLKHTDLPALARDLNIDGAKLKEWLKFYNL